MTSKPFHELRLQTSNIIWYRLRSNSGISGVKMSGIVACIKSLKRIFSLEFEVVPITIDLDGEDWNNISTSAPAWVFLIIL